MRSLSPGRDALPRIVAVTLSDRLFARLEAHCRTHEAQPADVITDAIDLHLDDSEGRYFTPTSLSAIELPPT